MSLEFRQSRDTEKNEALAAGRGDDELPRSTRTAKRVAVLRAKLVPTRGASLSL